MEKSQSRIQKSSYKVKKQEEILGKICQLSQQQYTYKSSPEQIKTVERRRSKTVNNLDVNGAQYKHRKSKANELGVTLA